MDVTSAVTSPTAATRMTEGWLGACCEVERRWSVRVHAEEMAIESADRYCRVLKSFARFATARGVTSCLAVSPTTCQDFIFASSAAQGLPSPSTRSFRLTAVRSAFDALRAAGLVASNPTSCLRVARDAGHPTVCPLTPEEAQRLRVAARTRVTDTLRPAAVTVALAGGSHGDIARAVVADVADTQLRLAGYGHSTRWVPLNASDAATLKARVASLRLQWRHLNRAWRPSTVPLAMLRPLSSYPICSVAPSVSTNLSRALHRAGIDRPGVRPRSLREYAANRTYALSNRVEDVAQHLGLVSLDAAARMVDNDWQHRWAEVIRADNEAHG